MTRTAAARNGRDGLREENVPTLVWMVNPSPRAITKPHRKSATATARIAVRAPEPVNRRLGTPHICDSDRLGESQPAGAKADPRDEPPGVRLDLSKPHGVAGLPLWER